MWSFWSISRLPVMTTASASLKSMSIPEDRRKPLLLSGATRPMTDVRPRWTGASVEAANKLEKLVKSSRLNLVQKGTTNEQGVVVFGKDSEGNALLDSGMYLIVQSESTGNTKVSPMLLSLPYITSDDWLYDVEAYPKAETHEVTTTPAPTATPKTTTPVRSTINTPTTSGTAKSVKTGDDTPIAAWIGVLAAAAVIIGAVVVLRKKKKEKR